LPEGVPGIGAGFAFRPETAKPMRELADILLHGPSSLTPGERELIAVHVSARNQCQLLLREPCGSSLQLTWAMLPMWSKQVKSDPDYLSAPVSAISLKAHAQAPRNLL
jgi:hypothetical protein